MGWNENVKKYIEEKQMTMLFLLLDSRIGMKSTDREMVSLMEENGVPYQIILTKTDLCPKYRLKEVLRDLLIYFEPMKYCQKEPILTSSQSLTGMIFLQEKILELAQFDMMQWRREIKRNVVYYL